MSTADRDTRIHELHAQGLTYREIRSEVGCSLGTVAKVIKRAKPTQATTAPPGANTKPVPDAVTVALIKAHAKTPNAELVPDNTVTAEVHHLHIVNGEKVEDDDAAADELPPSSDTMAAATTALAVIDAELVEAELVDTDTTIASIDDETGLGELASIANHYHHIAEFAQRTSVQAAWCAGQALLKVKDILPHGDLKRWIEANFRGSYRTAAAYMQIGKSADSAHLENLGSPKSIDSALKAIRTSRQPRPQTERKSAEARAITKLEKSVAAIEIAVERVDGALNELQRLGAVAAIRDQAKWLTSAWEQIDAIISEWIEAAEAGA